MLIYRRVLEGNVRWLIYRDQAQFDQRSRDKDYSWLNGVDVACLYDGEDLPEEAILAFADLAGDVFRIADFRINRKGKATALRLWQPTRQVPAPMGYRPEVLTDKWTVLWRMK